LNVVNRQGESAGKLCRFRRKCGATGDLLTEKEHDENHILEKIRANHVVLFYVERNTLIPFSVSIQAVILVSSGRQVLFRGIINLRDS
jgi:hypothetical protein